MASQWYYASGGKQLGPVNDDQLRQLAATGQIQASDLVWTTGMANWAPAGTVPGLMAPTPPLVPPTYAPQPLAYATPAAGQSDRSGLAWYLEVLKQYAVFTGRARRKEYWYFTLFNIVASLILGFIDGASGAFNAEAGVGLLGGLYTLAILVPSIAVSVRRLHDTDRSGWWLLIALVPLVGAILLLVFAVQEGTPSANRFGLNPKESRA